MCEFNLLLTPVHLHHVGSTGMSMHMYLKPACAPSEKLRIHAHEPGHETHLGAYAALKLEADNALLRKTCHLQSSPVPINGT